MRNMSIVVGAALLIGATPPPRQRVPLVKPMCDSAGHVGASNRIIVQGGLAPRPMSEDAAAAPKPGEPVAPGPGDQVATKVGGTGDPAALGPKQDDPGPPPADLAATRVGGTGDPAALGPKQDDPGPPPSPDVSAMTSCKVRPG